MKKSDNKPERRKLIHTYESLHMQRNKAKETMQNSLDRMGYIDAQNDDTVSHLGW